MPATRYPGRGTQRQLKEIKSMKKKLDELEIELGTARNRARELERGAHELAVQLEAAFNGVFQGLT